MIPDHQGVTCSPAQHGVFHDHAVGAHVHRAAIRTQHGAMQHATARSDLDLAAEYRRGCHVGLRVHGRIRVTMPDLHPTTMHHSTRPARLRRSPRMATTAQAIIRGISESAVLLAAASVSRPSVARLPLACEPDGIRLRKKAPGCPRRLIAMLEAR